MQITPDTKVSELLKHYPQLEEMLIRYSPAFAALRNPVLKKTVAKATSLQQAAKVGNVNVVDMVNALRKQAGLPSLEDDFCPESDISRIPVARSAPDAPVTYTLDVRPLIEKGEHPKDIVLHEANKLLPGECMEFIASFPPTPLIELLQKKGFRITMLAPKDGKVSTFVQR